MSSDGSTNVDETPETAFSLIGNEIRAEILRALGQEPYAEVSFSELRSRVDDDLDSGQFNYHLQQLLGQFTEIRRLSSTGYLFPPLEIRDRGERLAGDGFGDLDHEQTTRPTTL